MSADIYAPLPLAGCSILLPDNALSSEYSAALLRSLGADAKSSTNACDYDAAQDWANSGLVTLTGYADAPPLQGPSAIPSAASGALDALKRLVPQHHLAELDGARLLSERAAFMQLHRQGQISANGSCHLLAASDGWLALNLARDDDWALMPAWLENPEMDIDWQAVSEQVRLKPLDYLLQRGRLMALPIAPAQATNKPSSWFRMATCGLKKIKDTRPLVIDLSSLWAGPLCTHLLTLCGARVIKVESKGRPDGARLGNAEFFNLLNADKESVVIDFSTAKGLQQLRELIEKADIVIEGSRPRALKHLGINAEELVKTIPGLSWLSITAYGRAEPEANWVAFGDDAAIAAGVASATANPPIFCGDALADPLTGIHAALAAMAFWKSGGGVLVDLSLTAVTAHCLNFHPNIKKAKTKKKDNDWQLIRGEKKFIVKPPMPRHSKNICSEMGSDTEKVLMEFDISC